MIKIIALNILKIFDYYHQKKIINFLKRRGYKNFDTLFDVGAHHGRSIKLFSKNFNIKNLYSFEPSFDNFMILKKILKN